MSGRAAFWGLAVRRERWTLTWKARLLALAVLLAVAVAGILGVHPFLAVTHRVPSETLVVEGWIVPSVIQQAASEYRSGGYRRLILVRPILDSADKYESGKYNGDYVANLLIQAGVPEQNLIRLFPLVAKKDRTFHSALAVKEWLRQQGLPGSSLDLASVGAHARRSRLMYEKAFGDAAAIGVVAMPVLDYDPDHWWRSSEGVRDVIDESVAYCYARFIFRAGANS